MSHADDVYEHEIKKHDPAEGFDPTEPNVPAVWGFTVASFGLLILMIVAVQFYFQEVFDKAVHEKVLAAPEIPPAATSSRVRSGVVLVMWWSNQRVQLG